MIINYNNKGKFIEDKTNLKGVDLPSFTDFRRMNSSKLKKKIKMANVKCNQNIHIGHRGIAVYSSICII